MLLNERVSYDNVCIVMVIVSGVLVVLLLCDNVNSTPRLPLLTMYDQEWWSKLKRERRP